MTEQRRSPHKLRRVSRVGLQSLTLIFGFIALASLLDPRTFFTSAQTGLETAKRNLQQWALLINPNETVPTQANAEAKNAKVKVEPKHQSVTVPYGGSVYKVASDTYGNNTALGMDLIKEFNPDIKSLGRVSAGQTLLLPALTPETLLRKQSDGSYHLIAATFYRLVAADEYAQRLRNQGYQTTITPIKVSEDLLLHRVRIEGLKNLEEANQTWLAGLRNEWLGFASSQNGNSNQAENR